MNRLLIVEGSNLSENRKKYAGIAEMSGMKDLEKKL